MSESEKPKEKVPLKGWNTKEIAIANERASHPDKPKIDTTERARLVPVPPKPTEKPKQGKE